MLEPDDRRRNITGPADDPEASHGLREQRRRETRRGIADAAIELFERQGVTATTVEEIAEAAGIAPRTFYRHAVTKENALFVDDDSMERLIARVRAVDGSAPEVRRTIEQAYLASIDAFDAEQPDTHTRILRARRLVLAEPALLSRALARDDEYVQALTTLVLHADDDPDADEIQARAVVTAITTNVRLAYDEWARRAERGEKASVRHLYQQVRSVLIDHFTADDVG